MSDNERDARRILHNLKQTVTSPVKENRMFLEEFIEHLWSTFPNTVSNTGHTVLSMLHGGSAFERLAVHNKTDFDITLPLGDYLKAENFKVSRDPSGYFTLQYKSSVLNKRFSDCEGYLDSAQIRRSLFAALGNNLDRVKMTNATVTHEELLSAINIEVVENEGLRRSISIDLVPQIVFRTWGQCPDLKPLDAMPQSLRRYIDTLNKNKSPIMCFSLGVPNADSYSNSDQLFNISFSLLEKEFIISDVDLRDQVRMIKYIAHCRHWNEHHFKSFYAKRVAVKYYDQLQGKELWEGCKMLLFFLAQEVRNGVIDGYFVKNQPLRRWTQNETKLFLKEIEFVRNMNPRDIFGAA